MPPRPPALGLRAQPHERRHSCAWALTLAHESCVCKRWHVHAWWVGGATAVAVQVGDARTSRTHLHEAGRSTRRLCARADLCACARARVCKRARVLCGTLHVSGSSLAPCCLLWFGRAQAGVGAARHGRDRAGLRRSGGSCAEARPCHVCTETGLAPLATSAPGLGSTRPHLHQDWAHRCHICTVTGVRVCPA